MVWLILIGVMIVLFMTAVWYSLKTIDEDLKEIWDWINAENNE